MGTRWFPKFGGKGGNQAVAAAKLGAEVRMVAAVGQDGFADELIAGLEAAGVDHNEVKRVDTGSGMSVAIIDSDGDYSAVVVSGSNALIDTSIVTNPDLYTDASVLLLQNEIPAATNLAAAKAARASNVRVIWNAAPMRPDNESLLHEVDLIIVNAIEAEQFTGLKVTRLNEAKNAALKLCELDVDAVVTAGAAGCAWASKSGTAKQLAAQRVDNAQAHGAGDVFCGALAARLIRASLEESIEFASEKANRHVAGLPIYTS